MIFQSGNTKVQSFKLFQKDLQAGVFASSRSLILSSRELEHLSVEPIIIVELYKNANLSGILHAVSSSLPLFCRSYQVASAHECIFALACSIAYVHVSISSGSKMGGYAILSAYKRVWSRDLQSGLLADRRPQGLRGLEGRLVPRILSRSMETTK